MAKDNMFLGKARGSVGDVVFYQLDGQQVARSRNRNPRNPKTAPQLFQRGIMASITALYSAGKQLFDHSFEGYPVGAANQREFTSRNSRLLRSYVSSDLAGNTTEAEQLARIIGPKTQSPVGFAGLMVARGTYPMAVFSYTAGAAGSTDTNKWNLPAALTNEKCNEYAARVGLIAGDYYTFCGFYQDDGADPVLYRVESAGNNWAAIQTRQHFWWIRLGVKSSFIESTVAVAGKKVGDIFFLDTYSPDIMTDDIEAGALSFDFDLPGMVNSAYDAIFGTIGLIRSRLDSGLRSNSDLVWSAVNARFGIVSSWALQAWEQGTEAVGNSRLILEGGGF